MKTINPLNDINKVINFNPRDLDISRNDSFQEGLAFNARELLDKIEYISYNVNKMDKRVSKLEKTNLQLSENVENEKYPNHSFKAGSENHDKENK